MIDEEKLEEFSPKKLSKIIFNIYMRNKNIHKDIEMIIAANSSNAQEVVSMVKKVVSSIAKAKRQLYGEDAAKLASLLDLICDAIFNLSDFAPKEAFNLMKEFLKSGHSVCFRANETDVTNAFQEALRIFVKICERANARIDDVAEIACNLLVSEPRCKEDVYENAIKALSSILQHEGITLLKSKICDAYVNEKAIKNQKNTIEEESKNNSSTFYFHGKKAKKERDFVGLATELVLKRVRKNLKKIAEYQNDHEEYIMSYVYPKISYSSSDFSDDQKIEIAQYLIDTRRVSDAIKWMEQFPEQSYIRMSRRLLEAFIRLLSETGHKEQAQNERIKMFNRTLESEIYKEIEANATKIFMKDFRQKFIKSLPEYKNYFVVISFLLEMNWLAECAEYVNNIIDNFGSSTIFYDGKIRAIAEALQKEYPLTAVLLYRKILEDTLDCGYHHNFYNVAKDLVLSGQLCENIKSMEDNLPHKQYLAEIKKKYKGIKVNMFWEKYDQMIAKIQKTLDTKPGEYEKVV
ncbi:MAG: hypothetical protein LBC04_02890 [Holosporaceae bacterium]|jgi:hypothetical protein|nr:hypothetical protein [Holosporaceae bacterium]